MIPYLQILNGYVSIDYGANLLPCFRKQNGSVCKANPIGFPVTDQTILTTT